MTPTLQEDTIGRSSRLREGTDEQTDRDMRRRQSEVRSFRNRYERLMQRTGFGDKQSTKAVLEWFDKMKLTDDKGNLDSIVHREDFMNKDTVVEEGEAVYTEFIALMQRAKPHISEASYARWFERFRDTRELSSSESSFKIKKRWIKTELPGYVDRWVKASEDHAKLMKDPRIKDLLSYEKDFAILADRRAFLDLHYDKRTGLLADARAALLAAEKMDLDLYAKARTMLIGAASKHVLAHGKVGVWLERIFKSNADRKKIEAFVTGSAKNSLSDLILNWHGVKERFDKLMGKAAERGQHDSARGFKLVSEYQFLGMHYTQRLRYVAEAEHRLNDSTNIKEEQPIFVKIRHAIDVKDWVEAKLLIGDAKMMHLKDSDWPRLKSMEQFVSQFCPKAVEQKDGNKVMEAKARIDEIVSELPTELEPMVSRLLRGSHGNRNIHQFRWIVYNNKWCRSHGYLDDERARASASKENKELTKARQQTGQDIGRNDVLDNDTSDLKYIRKDEYSRHKATLLNVNVESGQANSTLTEWLEREQNPKTLYWMTYSAYGNDGSPKSENWHNELFAELTELRSLSRTINGAGFMYDGPNRPLLSMN